MGRYFWRGEKYAEADVLENRVEVSPKSLPAAHYLGRSYLGLDRYDDAYKTYDQAVDLASDRDASNWRARSFSRVWRWYMKRVDPRRGTRVHARIALDPNNADLQTKIVAARAGQSLIRTQVANLWLSFSQINNLRYMSRETDEAMPSCNRTYANDKQKF